MIQDASEKAIRGKDLRSLDEWVFRDRESMENRFGMEMEKVVELYKTDVGKKQLLEQMKSIDPNLNGNVDNALNLVNNNIEQLQKKESFLKKMLALPGRAVKAVGRTMKKHPVLTTAAGIAALIALLYFTTPLAPTIGAYGLKLIDAFKSVLAKLNIPIPETAVDAVANVPVTGGPVDEMIAEQAAEAFQSPGTMTEVTRGLTEAARDSGITEELLEQVSPAAEGILQSGTEAAVEGVTQPDVIDPLQRALRGLNN